MSESECAWVDDDGTACTAEAHARGYCNAHYQRIRRLEKREGDTMSDDQQPSGKGRPASGGSKKKKSGGGKMPAKQELESLLAMLGLGVSAWNWYDGQRIMEGSERLADALYQLAKENAAVRRALVAALAGSAWGAVGAALMPIVVPIAANHGMVPAEMAEKVGAPKPGDESGPPVPQDGNGVVASLFGNMTAPPNGGQPAPAPTGAADLPDDPADG